MKKAREFADQILDADDADQAMVDVAKEFLRETQELFRQRNARSNAAIFSVMDTQDQKWVALCRLLEKKLGGPVLREDGYSEMIKKFISEEVHLFWKNPDARRAKDPTSFRLTDECKALLRELSESFGVPQTGIIEMLVRDKARDERKYLVLYRCCGSPIEMQRFLNSELESGNELVALSGEYFVFRTLEEVD